MSLWLRKIRQSTPNIFISFKLFIILWYTLNLYNMKTSSVFINFLNIVSLSKKKIYDILQTFHILNICIYLRICIHKILSDMVYNNLHHPHLTSQFQLDILLIITCKQIRIYIFRKTISYKTIFKTLVSLLEYITQKTVIQYFHWKCI